MNIPRRPEDGPWHMKLKCRPNTPDEAIAAFLANTPMVRCEAYRCLLTEAECKARKKRAGLAKRVIVHHYQRCTMASDEWQRLSKCLKCGRTP